MRDKIVLITGGTGSFGQTFLKECLTKDVKQVRVYSRDELKQAQLQEQIQDERVKWLIGDVRDFTRLVTAMEGADIVVHAAAMKRIEKCEQDPQEAVKTNVDGTINVANACLKCNITNAILVSTDKAVYPVNLYGATKLVAEKVWIQSNTYRGINHPTKFSVVRYGNVLGSRGSVLHAFRDQMKKGSVKVTDPDMTRFFITLQQAVDLVQLAIEFQQGGEVFIPELKSAYIYHLAQLMQGESYKIEITNQRGGEKLHEVLMSQEECKRASAVDGFNIIHPEITTWPYNRGRINNIDFVTSETAAKIPDEQLLKLIRTIK